MLLLLLVPCISFTDTHSNQAYHTSLILYSIAAPYCTVLLSTNCHPQVISSLSDRLSFRPKCFSRPVNKPTAPPSRRERDDYDPPILSPSDFDPCLLMIGPEVHTITASSTNIPPIGVAGRRLPQTSPFRLVCFKQPPTTQPDLEPHLDS